MNLLKKLKRNIQLRKMFNKEIYNIRNDFKESFKISPLDSSYISTLERQYKGKLNQKKLMDRTELYYNNGNMAMYEMSKNELYGGYKNLPYSIESVNDLWEKDVLDAYNALLIKESKLSIKYKELKRDL